MTGQDEAPQTQRLDRWLWYARIFKTRTLAAKFVQDGHVRVTTNQATVRAEKPSFTIRPGDTLVFTRGEQLRILEIIALAARRGPASEAQTLYTDQSPPRPPKEERTTAPFSREKGAGRPTKKDRRELQALKTSDLSG